MDWCIPVPSIGFRSTVLMSRIKQFIKINEYSNDVKFAVSHLKIMSQCRLYTVLYTGLARWHNYFRLINSYTSISVCTSVYHT